MIPLFLGIWHRSVGCMDINLMFADFAMKTVLD